MKTPLWALLLCLCVPGQCSDCQGDCLTCLHILPQEVNFNTLVCLVECEGNLSPAYTWDLCHKASLPPQLPSLSFEGTSLLKRAQEEVEAIEEAGYPATLPRFDHVARGLGLDELGRERWISAGTAADAYNSQQPLEMEERNEEVGDKEKRDTETELDRAAGRSLSKRFGGFLKGRHGYRKLMGPGKSLQKRYGGFIGIRKSARKWNNQKRFSEFLKQYLGMSTRASESYNSVSADITQQNEV
ncbi:prepronociceptin [Esox lucius]|uniref:Prepronociceptin a n=1 Tax=Esox lucius TaxID=8010 RepID=A0AAY5KCZ5_ESOLU|nr:prepronociceptin [Esox lucius]